MEERERTWRKEKEHGERGKNGSTHGVVCVLDGICAMTTG